MTFDHAALAVDWERVCDAAGLDTDATADEVIQALRPHPTETDNDSNLVEHARRELTLIGEEPEVVGWYCRVITEFASIGHSGGSASVAIPTLNELLQYHALSPLTDDPDEWVNHSDISSAPIWQNRRQSSAFSEDGGITYYTLEERDIAGSMDATPLHRSGESGKRA